MATIRATQPIRILLADDGSQHALAAAALVHDLPLPEGSEVTILGVLSPREAGGYAVLQADLEQARNYLREAGLPARMEMHGGQPAEKLIQYAEQYHPDLIVMGAKGRRADTEIQVGGVAQHVIEFARWPVLMARSPYNGLNHVLLLTDGSRHSQRATQFLAHFPLPETTRVSVLHVLPPILEPVHAGERLYGAVRVTPPQPPGDEERPAWQLDQEREGRDLLRGAVEILEAEGLETRSILTRGDISIEVNQYVRANHMDLIVAGSGRQSTVDSWLLGGVSRKLIQHSEASVLIVRGLDE